MDADLSEPGASVDGRAHWHRLIAKLGGSRQQQPGVDVVRLWVPWYRPVQAGCYTDLDTLDALHGWVRELHRAGRVNPGVVFTLDADSAVPVGVLYDPGEPIHQWTVLRPGGYLVHSGRGLGVLNERRFHATYCDVAYAYDQRGGRRARSG